MRSCTVRRSLRKPFAQFVGGQFVDGPHAAVAEVVDVVDLGPGLGVAQLDDVADGVEVVERPQRHLVLGHVLLELAVDAEAADATEAVAVGIAELLAEQLPGLFELRRIAGAETLVDAEQRLSCVRMMPRRSGPWCCCPP